MKCLKRLLQGCICAATAISLTSGIAFAAESKEQTTTSVAKVGDTYYDSLAEAVNAIETEGTIELVKDAEVNTVINVFEGKSITVELGNHSITPSAKCSSGKIFRNYGTLTIRGDAQGTIDASAKTDEWIAIENRGELSVESGTIVGNMRAILVTDQGSAEISGGTIESRVSNAGDSGAIVVSNGSLTVSGDAVIIGEDVAVRSTDGDVHITQNAHLIGQFGIMLFNNPTENEPTSGHSSLTMNGGIVEATYGFALSGNNLQSALCSAEITGGTLLAPQEATAIYWPMEGELTIGGNAIVEGGTGIEAKMGTITIQDQAMITGTGDWLEDRPNAGGSQSEGSALLASTQMYGANTTQYINSPDLTVKVLGGTLTGTKGNAITVYNTEDTDAQEAMVSVAKGELICADGRANVKVIMDSGNDTTELISSEDENILITAGSMTEVSVSSQSASAIVNQDGKTAYYGNVEDALKANDSSAASNVNIYVIKDSAIGQEALASKNVRLTTAKGVELQIRSDVEDMIVKETLNADGSKTYELVEASQLKAPSVEIHADRTSAHAGETITLSAVAAHDEKVAYSYAWYKDGVLLTDADNAELSVTEGGDYTVVVTASKQNGNEILYSAETTSVPIRCTIEPHDYVWKVVKEATETADGLRQQVCTICGDVKAEEVIPALKTAGDATKLKDLIDQVAALNSKDYTERSWKVLMEKWDAARKVMEAADADQKSIDAAYQELLAAYNDLELAEEESIPTAAMQSSALAFGAAALLAGLGVLGIALRKRHLER